MIAFFLLLVFGAEAQACSNLQIRQLDNISFNGNSSPTETFEVRRSGNTGCDFFLTVDNGGESSFTNRRINHENGVDFIPMQICADASCANVLKHFPEASSTADVLHGTFLSGSSAPDDIYFELRPKLGTTDYQRYGRFESFFNVRLYQGTVNGSRSLEDTENFRLRYDMGREIDLSIVNTGSPFDPSSTTKTLNFGLLSAGQQLGFDLVVKYNAGYRIRLSSFNNGRLKHASATDTIPYTLNMSGNAVSLELSKFIPVTIAQGTGINPSGGRRIPGLVTIGTIGSAQSGSYSDSITVTVSTTE